MSPSGVEPLSATGSSSSRRATSRRYYDYTEHKGTDYSLLLLLQQEIAGEGDVDVDVISGDTKATPEGV